MGELKLKLLGAFQAFLGQEPLPPLRLSKVQALLIFLAAEAFDHGGRRHAAPPVQRREQLMALLWPESGLKAAQDNLRQALYQLRKVIPDHQMVSGESIPLLQSSRVAVNIHPDYPLRLDVADFARALREGRQEAAVALYKGEFLADFYLADSNTFETWAGVRRSTYRQQAADTLERLASRYLQSGQYGRAERAARRQLAIDDLNECACRQLMEAQARLGKRRKALETFAAMQEKLEDELGVEPSRETEALRRRIQEEDLAPKEAAAPVPALAQMLPLPKEQRPLFVGRETELEQLATCLTAAGSGRGCLRFVVGGAGRGKTALASEFARRALDADAELLVLSGQCRSLSGLGEPYLPFRHILAQLGGDVRSPALLAAAQARRFRSALPDTLPLLLERGAGLIDTLLPGTDLRRSAGAAGLGAEWLERLDVVSEEAPHREQLFGEVTALLKAVAAERPLLLIIEDLHWADAVSTALLFHLCFELSNSPVLMLGTYRPEEVDRGDEHPLAAYESEWKRQFGDIWLDLSQMDAHEGRAFVDAYLDSEPNRLDEAFRRALFTLTGGHALFVVELLRGMQERGDLCRDETGFWQARPSVDWRALPARVEGAIEQRFGRLDSELQKLLGVAAVEGEQFTLGVVAAVSGVEEQRLRRRLSRELAHRHRLVQTEGASGPRARYRFRHQLFQQFLYQALLPGERSLLHESVGLALEAMAAETDTPAAELAWHFDQAGNQEKALAYSLQAGDAARLLYATEEAVFHYERALAILKQRGKDEEAARVLMKLGLTYTNAFEFEKAQRAYEESFALSRRAPEPPRQSQDEGQSKTLRLAAVPQYEMEEWLREAGRGLGLFPGLFPGLVRLTADLDVVPDLALSWDTLDEGLTYRFYLRDDARWSDGRAVTADDFVFAWRRALDAQTRHPYAELLYDIEGAAEYGEISTGEEVQFGVQAFGDCCLQVKLVEPTAYFLQMLAQPIATPLPKHVVEAHGQKWTEPEHIVSCGPYVLQAREENGVLLVRNLSYYGSFDGNVERVEIRFCPAPSESLELYREGLIDYVDLWHLSLSEFQQARQEFASEYVSGPYLATCGVGFNTSDPPFNDQRMRRALVLATDRCGLVSTYEPGRSLPATGGFVPPGMPGHVPGIGLRYDPRSARQLLAEAGYAEGSGLPVLRAYLLPWDVQGLLRHTIESWQRVLGIRIEWQEIAFADHDARVKAERPHVFSAGWLADYPDPDSFLRAGVRYFSELSGAWEHEAYADLVGVAKKVPDHESRLQLFRRAEQILVREAPLLPLIYRTFHVLVKRRVLNACFSPMGGPRWERIVLEPPVHLVEEEATQPAEHTAIGSLPPTSRVLRLIAGPQPDTFDMIAQGVEDYGFFPGLVDLTDDLTVVPAVAHSWDIHDNGCSYLFHLRHDVYWSDGRPVTAQDFVYAWRRALDPEKGSHYAGLLYDIVGAAEYHQGRPNQESALGFDCLDDHTLKVELEQPTAYILQLLAHSVAAPVPRHTVGQYGPCWSDPNHFVGSGPFLLHSRRAEATVLRRNPTYFGLFDGNVEQVEILHRAHAAFAAAYEGDEIDIVGLSQLSTEDQRSLVERYPDEYRSVSNLATYYACFDVLSEPFSDPRVRQAFALATDRRTFRQGRAGNRVPATGGFVPPGLPGHTPGIALPFDPCEAKRLLTEAGYAGGKGLPLLRILYLPWDAKPVSQFLIRPWQELLGAKFEPIELPWSEFFPCLSSARPHIGVIGWGADYPDPDSFLRVGLRRHCQWRHEPFNTLIDEARNSLDHAYRLDLFRKAEEILIQEVPILPLYYVQISVLVKPWIRNFRFGPLMLRPRWHRVVIEPH